MVKFDSFNMSLLDKTPLAYKVTLHRIEEWRPHVGGNVEYTGDLCLRQALSGETNNTGHLLKTNYPGIKKL